MKLLDIFQAILGKATPKQEEERMPFLLFPLVFHFRLGVAVVAAIGTRCKLREALQDLKDSVPALAVPEGVVHTYEVPRICLVEDP